MKRKKTPKNQDKKKKKNNEDKAYIPSRESIVLLEMEKKRR